MATEMHTKLDRDGYHLLDNCFSSFSESLNTFLCQPNIQVVVVVEEEEKNYET